MDVSADLTELGRTPVAVICAGAKSILDIPRTLEYLETQAGCRPGSLDGVMTARVRGGDTSTMLLSWSDRASVTACTAPCSALLGNHFRLRP
jgi:hypothetical protein